MDDTWRKVLGTKIMGDGEAIRLAVMTVDGRTMELQLVPEMITLLVAELMRAKTLAHLAATGGVAEVDPLDPVHMRQPIEARELIVTEYVDRGRCLIQVPTEGGAIFEFLVPLDKARRQEARG